MNYEYSSDDDDQHVPPGIQENYNSFSSENPITEKGKELEFPEGAGGGKGYRGHEVASTLRREAPLREPGVPPDDDESMNNEDDEESLDEPHHNKQYFIGLCKLIRPDNYFIMLSVISSQLFFRYSEPAIRAYLECASILYVHGAAIDIMKLEFSNYGSIAVIKMTFWIRLVQRCWRSVLRRRMEIIRKRASFTAQRHFELTGRYSYGLNRLPGLKGML